MFWSRKRSQGSGNTSNKVKKEEHNEATSQQKKEIENKRSNGDNRSYPDNLKPERNSSNTFMALTPVSKIKDPGREHTCHPGREPTCHPENLLHNDEDNPLTCHLLYCKHCFAYFLTKEDYDHHTVSCDKSKSNMTCRTCSTAFKTRKGLRQHISPGHSLSGGSNSIQFSYLELERLKKEGRIVGDIKAYKPSCNSKIREIQGGIEEKPVESSNNSRLSSSDITQHFEEIPENKKSQPQKTGRKEPSPVSSDNSPITSLLKGSEHTKSSTLVASRNTLNTNSITTLESVVNRAGLSQSTNFITAEGIGSNQSSASCLDNAMESVEIGATSSQEHVASDSLVNKKEKTGETQIDANGSYNQASGQNSNENDSIGNQNVIKCTICNIYFIHIHSYESHIKKCVSLTENKCLMCGKKFVSLAFLHQHMSSKKHTFAFKLVTYISKKKLRKLISDQKVNANDIKYLSKEGWRKEKGIPKVTPSTETVEKAISGVIETESEDEDVIVTEDEITLLSQSGTPKHQGGSPSNKQKQAGENVSDSDGDNLWEKKCKQGKDVNSDNDTKEKKGEMEDGNETLGISISPKQACIAATTISSTCKSQEAKVVTISAAFDVRDNQEIRVLPAEARKYSLQHRKDTKLTDKVKGGVYNQDKSCPKQQDNEGDETPNKSQRKDKKKCADTSRAKKISKPKELEKKKYKRIDKLQRIKKVTTDSKLLVKKANTIKDRSQEKKSMSTEKLLGKNVEQRTGHLQRKIDGTDNKSKEGKDYEETTCRMKEKKGENDTANISQGKGSYDKYIVKVSVEDHLNKDIGKSRQDCIGRENLQNNNDNHKTTGEHGLVELAEERTVLSDGDDTNCLKPNRDGINETQVLQTDVNKAVREKVTVDESTDSSINSSDSMPCNSIESSAIVEPVPKDNHSYHQENNSDPSRQLRKKCNSVPKTPRASFTLSAEDSLDTNRLLTDGEVTAISITKCVSSVSEEMQKEKSQTALSQISTLNSTPTMLKLPGSKSTQSQDFEQKQVQDRRVEDKFLHNFGITDDSHIDELSSEISSCDLIANCCTNTKNFPVENENQTSASCIHDSHLDIGTTEEEELSDISVDSNNKVEKKQTKKRGNSVFFQYQPMPKSRKLARHLLLGSPKKQGHHWEWPESSSKKSRRSLHLDTLVNNCPGCFMSIDVSTVIYNTKTRETAFWCNICRWDIIFLPTVLRHT